MNAPPVRTPYVAYAAAAAAGAVLWWGATVLGGRREAWDAPVYWVAAYPLSIVFAAAFSWWQPARPWRWALAVMWGQATMLALLASSFGLWPLGLILFAVLGLPVMGVCALTSRLRTRQTSK